jgi:hypothetical protein
LRTLSPPIPAAICLISQAATKVLESLPPEGFLQMTGPVEKIRQQDRRFSITLASIAILTIVAFIILIAQKARAEEDIGGTLTDHSHPGLGRPNSLRLPKPPIDPSGNIVHRNIEIVDTPILIPGPPIDASLLLPTSMKSQPILIDIDVMQVFIPWEFRVTGAFKPVKLEGRQDTELRTGVTPSRPHTRAF